MAKDCILEIKDEVNIKWHDLDPNTRRKLVQKLEFFIPQARHSPAFKLGRWNGKISFCDIGGRSYVNLLDHMLPIVQEAGYHISIEDKRKTYDFEFKEVSADTYSHIKWPEGHPAAGQGIELRDHQVEMINEYIQNFQSTIVCPTAGGKTIVCASLSEKVEKYGKSIVIVPSQDLVTQTEEDYINFGLDVGVIYGGRKEYDKTHTICTWQSLEVMNKKFKKGEFPEFEDFLEDIVCVIVDETHKSKSTVLRELLAGPLSNIPIRWGLTGTLPEADFDRLAIVGVIGPNVRTIKPKDLQEKGYLSDLEIEIWQLQDHGQFKDYQSELAWLTSNKERLSFVAEEIIKMSKDNGNTLVLVDRIATGEILRDMIPDSVFLCGSVKSVERKKEYKSVQSANGKIILASFGIASTGISINRIFNLVLVEPGKSFVRVIQSIGRGLRVAEDKNFVNVYDITSTCKYSRRHLTKRKKFYAEAEYPHKVIKKDYSGKKK